MIITAGVLIADVLARLIDKGTGGADRFASTLVRWATIALATAMGLRFMGIADDVVLLAFGLVLGAAAVAAALAFGLGGRNAAGQVAQSWADKLTRRSGGQASVPSRYGTGSPARGGAEAPPLRNSPLARSALPGTGNRGLRSVHGR